jgi:hypothetical protein
MVGKVANRDGVVNSWQKSALNAIKPWMKHPRDGKRPDETHTAVSEDAPHLSRKLSRSRTSSPAQCRNPGMGHRSRAR